MAKKAVKKKPAAKRGRGRPKIRAIVPERDDAIITEMHFTGYTCEQIGLHFGCTAKNISQHIVSRIRAQWRKETGISIEDILAEIEAIKRLAWKNFRDKEGVSEIREMTEEAMLEQAEAVTKKKPGRPKKDKLTLVKRVISKSRRIKNFGWLQVVQWCIEERNKVLGNYKRDDAAANAVPVIPAILVEVKTKAEADKVLSYRDFTKAAAGSPN